jgi:hypothetical protein
MKATAGGKSPVAASVTVPIRIKMTGKTIGKRLAQKLGKIQSLPPGSQEIRRCDRYLV